MRILCLHGVNHLEPGSLEAPPTPAEQTWRQAIAAAAQQWGLAPDVRFVAYNRFFVDVDLSPVVLTKAVATLTTSTVWHGIGDLLGLGARGFGPEGGLADTLEWTAGMVVEWAGNDPLRARLRETLLAALEEHEPQLLLAHSLGSLIAYDTLARPANAGRRGVKGLALATFGSQIGHPALREAFGGRLVAIPALRHWFHLYNRRDHVFTAPLDLRFQREERANFSQHNTLFNTEGDLLNHNADRYLLHAEALGAVWRDAATSAGAVPETLPGMPRLVSAAPGPRGGKARRSAGTGVPAVIQGKPSHRALLVGIGEYANPANNLAGCRSDVFLMSRLLQETGFAAQDIRILLDSRATAAAIHERLHWLLDGAGDGQDRVFYYAGHGAQIPAYGTGETVDHLDECLVPHDFDWTRERAFVDDQFFSLYSQLPENTRFLAVFDCCHSGGMTRDGGVRARGLTPPDDIRHRILEWSAATGTFSERAIGGEPMTAHAGIAPARDYLHGPVRQLGCGVALRPADARRFNQVRTAFGHRGPFMPFLIEACSEGELAYEYRHGSESNGAFTWFMAQALREAKSAGPVTWESLVKTVAARLKENGYRQRPQLVCPRALRRDPVPWMATRT